MSADPLFRENPGVYDRPKGKDEEAAYWGKVYGEGLNLYCYVKGNPVTLTDPNGRESDNDLPDICPVRRKGENKTTKNKTEDNQCRIIRSKHGKNHAVSNDILIDDVKTSENIHSEKNAFRSFLTFAEESTRKSMRDAILSNDPVSTVVSGFSCGFWQYAGYVTDVLTGKESILGAIGPYSASSKKYIMNQMVKYRFLAEVEEEALRLTVANIKNNGLTIVGPYNPKSVRYTIIAEQKGASYFSLGDKWDELLKAGGDPWKFNRKFLDIIAERGDTVITTISKSKIDPSSYLYKEIDYLIHEKGYKWIDQYTLSKKGK